MYGMYTGDKTGLGAALWKEDVKRVFELISDNLTSFNGSDKNIQDALILGSRKGNRELMNMLLTIPNIDVNRETEGYALLNLAALCKNWEIVDLLLERSDIDVNEKESNGYTTLFYALLYDNVEIVRRLLSYPNIDLTGSLRAAQNVDTAKLIIFQLRSYVRAGRVSEDEFKSECSNALLSKCWLDPAKDKDIIKLLIENGVNFEVRGCEENRTPLGHAILPDEGPMDTDIVKWLIEAGADLDAEYSNNSTIFSTLMEQMYEGFIRDASIVELLAKKVTDVNQKNFLLAIACRLGYVEILQGLIDNGANVNSHSSLQLALDIYRKKASFAGCWKDISECEPKCREIVEILVRAGVNVNDLKALMIAIQYNYVEIVRIFVDQAGADVNMQDEKSRTALMLATEMNNKEIIEILIKPGLSLDLLNFRGENPLHWAVSKEEVEICRKLVDAGANVNVQTNESCKTPLMIAAERGNTEICDILIKAGANVNYSNGYTSLMIAAERGYADICNKLVQSGTTIDLQGNNQVTALLLAATWGKTEICDILIKVGANVNHSTSNGNTPLLVAVKNGHVDVCNVLIKARAAVDYQNEYQETLLFFASERGDAKICDILIKAGVDVNHQDEYRHEISLYVAVENGHEETCGVLIKAGADINHHNYVGETPLVRYRNLEIARMLLENGAIITSGELEQTLMQDDPSIVAHIMAAKWCQNSQETPPDYLDIQRNEEIEELIEIIITNKFINEDYDKEQIDNFFAQHNNNHPNNLFLLLRERVISYLTDDEEFIEKKTQKIIKYLSSGEPYFPGDLDWVSEKSKKIALEFIETSLKKYGVVDYNILATMTIQIDCGVDFTDRIHRLVADNLEKTALLEDDLRRASGEIPPISYFHPVIRTIENAANNLHECGQLSNFLESVIGDVEFWDKSSVYRVLTATVGEEVGTHFPKIHDLVASNNLTEDLRNALTHPEDFILTRQLIGEIAVECLT